MAMSWLMVLKMNQHRGSTLLGDALKFPGEQVGEQLFFQRRKRPYVRVSRLFSNPATPFIPNKINGLQLDGCNPFFV
jgi:hypothetical protein